MITPLAMVCCYVVATTDPWVSFHRDGMPPQHFGIDRRRWDRLTKVFQAGGKFDYPGRGIAMYWSPIAQKAVEGE